jgi:hypothetical protein
MAVQVNEHPENYNPNYLAHEYMSTDWNPLCVTDVRAAMAAIGLEPVGSATLLDNYDLLVLGQAAREALASICDDNARELARDFLIDQFLRRDMFVREGRRIGDEERRDRLLASTFILTRPASMIGYAASTPAGRLEFDNAAARSIVRALASGPMRLAELATASDIDPQDALANALVLCAVDAIRPVEQGRTSVGNINQAVRRRLGTAEELPQLALPCGTALPINDALRHILRDGDQTEQSGVVEWQRFLNTSGIRCNDAA